MHRQAHSEPNGRANGKVHYLNAREGKAVFDREARRYMKMSGDEFVARYRAGEFGDPDNPYRPELMQLVMLLPFAE